MYHKNYAYGSIVFSLLMYLLKLVPNIPDYKDTNNNNNYYNDNSNNWVPKYT